LPPSPPKTATSFIIKDWGHVTAHHLLARIAATPMWPGWDARCFSWQRVSASSRTTVAATAAPAAMGGQNEWTTTPTTTSPPADNFLIKKKRPLLSATTTAGGEGRSGSMAFNGQRPRRKAVLISGRSATMCRRQKNGRLPLRIRRPSRSSPPIGRRFYEDSPCLLLLQPLRAQRSQGVKENFRLARHARFAQEPVRPHHGFRRKNRLPTTSKRIKHPLNWSPGRRRTSCPSTCGRRVRKKFLKERHTQGHHRDSPTACPSQYADTINADCSPFSSLTANPGVGAFQALTQTGKAVLRELLLSPISMHWYPPGATQVEAQCECRPFSAHRLRRDSRLRAHHHAPKQPRRPLLGLGCGVGSNPYTSAPRHRPSPQNTSSKAALGIAAEAHKSSANATMWHELSTSSQCCREDRLHHPRRGATRHITSRPSKMFLPPDR